MFVGSYGNRIRNMRLLRDSRACNRYMVLIQLDSLESAEQFYREYEGKLFSSIGPECCRILSVSSIIFRNTTTNSKVRTILWIFLLNIEFSLLVGSFSRCRFCVGTTNLSCLFGKIGFFRIWTHHQSL